MEFTYDADGQRLTKTVNGVTHTYYYAGSKLLRETYGSNTLDFFYNADGSPYALKYNGTLYYYITNLQGDVMRVVDADGNGVARYRYDPYGNLIYSTGSFVNNNPLRYRGYYYDSETGFYYLQSRYYDPELGRFINADDFASTGQGILGHNMFAYCGNNPVARADKNGAAWELALVGGGSVGLGLTTTTVLSALVPVALVVVGIVVVTGITYAALDYAKSSDNPDNDGRITSPIGRRGTYNTRKKAYEAAKRAGGGKEPRHDPNGHDDDNRPHFHPNVPNKYRKTPKGASSHDHYFYPR